jgi:predicted nucleic acid-binding protein
MAERPAYVPDASIVARWELRNPPYLEPALRVFGDFDAERIELLAPHNLLVEVSGAIHHAMLTSLISPEQVEARIQDVLDLAIPTLQIDDLLLPAHRLSRRLGCSFYDSLYLAVSDLTGYPFLHADGRLHRTLAGRFVREVWIEDYR